MRNCCLICECTGNKLYSYSLMIISYTFVIISCTRYAKNCNVFIFKWFTKIKYCLLLRSNFEIRVLIEEMQLSIKKNWLFIQFLIRLLLGCKLDGHRIIYLETEPSSSIRIWMKLIRSSRREFWPLEYKLTRRVITYYSLLVS